MHLDDIDIIGELANAHEGDPQSAVQMINSVSDSVDAVKLQIFTADDLAVESHEDYELYQELSLSSTEINTIVDAAHRNNVYILADILGKNGINKTEEADIDGFKIHSSDLVNFQLIEKVAQIEKPTIISAGGATTVEIRDALSSFERVSDAPLGLVYGYQNYPTKLKDSHLNRLRNLISEFSDDYFVGYTSHLDGSKEEAKRLPAWAVAAGADFLEIHTILNRSVEKTDYHSSLEPSDFERMKTYVEKVQAALGESTLQMSDSEIEYRDAHKKCVIATQELDIGKTISKRDIALKRPEKKPNVSFNDLNKVIGKTVKRTIEEQTPVHPTSLEYTVAATLACRAESTRLYGKPLQLIGEKCILAHQISQLKQVDSIDEIVLAISDTASKPAFEQFATEQDLEYIVGDEVDVLNRLICAGNAVDADIAVRLTTENPFTYQKGINNQVEYHVKKNADLTVTRNLPLGAFTEVISIHALEQAHRLGDDRHKSELASSFITESFNIVGIEPPKSLNRPDIRLTVDNPCDLILVRDIWESVADNRDPYDLESILNHYDENDLCDINGHKPDGTDDDVIDTLWHIYDEESDIDIIS
jgi:sialic acid synthase SpsE/spore coat polysaccharide biosynthesis protein SpsF (cytidylyltransferase family)